MRLSVTKYCKKPKLNSSLDRDEAGMLAIRHAKLTECIGNMVTIVETDPDFVHPSQSASRVPLTATPIEAHSESAHRGQRGMHLLTDTVGKCLD